MGRLFKTALLALICFGGSAAADKRVATRTFTFTPPGNDSFPIQFSPGGEPLRLQIGDRVVFRKPDKASQVTFSHKCFKKGESFLFIPLSPDQNLTKTEPFQLTLNVNFAFTANAKVDLQVGPPMTYVAPTDGKLSAVATTYDSSKYTATKNRRPCPDKFDHKGVSASSASAISIDVVVCRSGVRGDDPECAQ